MTSREEMPMRTETRFPGKPGLKDYFLVTFTDTGHSLPYVADLYDLAGRFVAGERFAADPADTIGDPEAIASRLLLTKLPR